MERLNDYVVAFKHIRMLKSRLFVIFEGLNAALDDFDYEFLYIIFQVSHVTQNSIEVFSDEISYSNYVTVYFAKFHWRNVRL